MKHYIVGIGEALWDLFPEGKKIGGAPANFAYHMSQFGFESIVVSAVGKDADGDEIIANFTEKGLLQQIERVDFPTGTVRVEVDEKGVPKYEICEGVAWDHIPFTAALEEIARSTKGVCFGSLAQRHPVSHDTILRFIEQMPAASVKIFDINLRQHYYTEELIRKSLEKCTILKINDEEIITLGKLFDYSETEMEAIALRLLQEYALDLVILTCGSVGSYVFAKEGRSYLDTPRVEVADTVGAGDSFTAAFCASLLKGDSIEAAHRKAVAVSAYVCTQAGAMPVLPESLKD